MRLAAATCPSCSASVPEGAHFCPECGTSLGQRAEFRKERKFATALFADIVGSTRLTEQHDPEVVQGVISQVFDRLSSEVERYGGLLEKFMGDALLAVFGVRAHEDDPERAVRCALEMQAVMSEINRTFAQDARPTLEIRIGVEAGEVLVDHERARGRRDRMLTGDAVNAAARLQVACEPGQVLVGPAAADLTKDVISYEQLPAIELKGKAEPVAPFRARHIKARLGSERTAVGLEARLVGRDEELAQLEQIVHRVEREGRPALVTVLGDAGVGKSRLAREFRQRLDTQSSGIYWRRGRCPSYGGAPYSALADAVKAHCEVLEDDSPEEAGAKVRHALFDLFGGDEIEGEIQALIGASSGAGFSRERLFDSWRRFFERMAARYPVVLVLEDIHWADDGLLDFVDHLADFAQGPILTLTLARSELLDLRPTWGGGKRNYTALYLDPLTETESAAMLRELFQGDVPESLREVVLARSEGNPLFAEEIVRMFLDRGTLRLRESGGFEVAAPIEAVDVPRSIHALLSARLDGLPDDEKSLLQDAAVIGRIFWSGAASRLAGCSLQEAEGLLRSLRLKEIVISREPPTFSNESEYSFHHVLMRDVSYESLPKSLRAEKHAEVATWAEEIATATQVPELIATHATQALAYLDELGESGPQRRELERRACAWARQAGDRARSLWQARAAIDWYRRAIALADVAELDLEGRAQVWDGLAASAQGVLKAEEVMAAYEHALALYQQLDRQLDAGRVETRMAFMSQQAGDDAALRSFVTRARARLEPLGDTAELSDALELEGRHLALVGKLDEAEEPLRAALEMARRLGHRRTEAHALQELALLAHAKGEWRENLTMMEDAYQIARALGDPELFFRTVSHLALLLAMRGGTDARRARDIADDGMRQANRFGRRWDEGYLAAVLAELAQRQGRLEEAQSLQEASLEATTETYSRFRPYWMGLLARMRLLRGEIAEAAAMRDEAVKLADATGVSHNNVPLEWVSGLLAQVRNEPDAAERCLMTALRGALEAFESARVEILVDASRALAQGPRRNEVADITAEIARGVPPDGFEGACVSWAEGLLAEPGDRSIELLGHAVAWLRDNGFELYHGRCLIDIAYAERAAGRTALPSLEAARRVLGDCGALLYLKEAESALAELDG